MSNNCEAGQQTPETLNNKKSAIKDGGLIFSTIMLIPAILHFLILYCGVNLNSILLAFSVPTPDGGQQFSLYNFQRFFANMANPESQVYMALFNTLEYYLLKVGKYALTSIVSYFFYKKLPGHTAYKILFFLPSMIPDMVYISIFKQFISKYGPLYEFLGLFGYQMPSLLLEASTAEPVIMFYHFWSGFGPQLLIQVGAMNRIPSDVIDAAKIDGCIGFKEFWFIILPLVFETIATYFLLGIVEIFQSTGPFLFFVGSDMPEVYTLQYWIFQQTIGGASNYPAAIGLVFTMLALPLVLISRYFINKVETVTY